MDAAWATVYIVAIGMQSGLIWFAIKTYIDLKSTMVDNERLKDKIAELKELIRSSK